MSFFDNLTEIVECLILRQLFVAQLSQLWVIVCAELFAIAQKPRISYVCP